MCGLNAEWGGPGQGKSEIPGVQTLHSLLLAVFPPPIYLFAVILARYLDSNKSGRRAQPIQISPEGSLAKCKVFCSYYCMSFSVLILSKTSSWKKCKDIRHKKNL